MPATPPRPAVFGPFDGDFDPFEEDEDLGVLVEFGRERGVGMLPCPQERGRGTPRWQTFDR